MEVVIFNYLVRMSSITVLQYVKYHFLLLLVSCLKLVQTCRLQIKARIDREYNIAVAHSILTLLLICVIMFICIKVSLNFTG